MSKKKKPFPMAPLQRLTVKPIEDPAEQAALDARLKQSEEATSAASVGTGASSKMTASLVLELCRRLSAKARLTVASDLSDQLSVEQRIEVIQRWASQLPAEFRGQLAEGLVGRLEDAREKGSIDCGPTRSASRRG
jgi:hypothetical protein